jgi:O-antigen biosynthesis protein WbqV
MGASKRIVEMLTMASEAEQSKLSSCAVRFGNVLASAGSVVPLFEEQIARGGPVTVTHKDVNRYFMTTEEAAALVLQAAALNANQSQNKASIYVLEMGEPVNIAQLARQLIRLRGFVPDRDIKIEYTDLRPGEKITEHLTGDDENLETTYVKGVMRFRGDIADPASMLRRIDKLLEAIYRRNKPAIRKALKALLPDYEPNGGLS